MRGGGGGGFSSVERRVGDWHSCLVLRAVRRHSDSGAVQMEECTDADTADWYSSDCLGVGREHLLTVPDLLCPLHQQSGMIRARQQR